MILTIYHRVPGLQRLLIGGVLSIASLLVPILFVEASVVVEFSHTPLFIDADVKPGDSTTRQVTVTNTTTVEQPISFTSQNTFNTGLADVMRLTVSDGSITVFDDTFSNFFLSPVNALGTLLPGQQKTWSFVASIPTSVGNTYQRTQFGFDLVIGWPGGSTTDTPTGGGGGGGNSFRLFNERVATVDVTNRAVTLTWNTNVPATSYLVCGNTVTGPFTLDPAADRFGYQFVIPEVTTLSVGHSLTLTDLLPGTYECRPASRRTTNQNFTVGLPLTFTIPEGIVAGEAISQPDLRTLINAVMERAAQPSGSVLGISKGAFGGPTYEEWKAEIAREQVERSLETDAAATSSTTTEPDASSVSEQPEEMTVKDRITSTVATHPFWFSSIPLCLLAILGWFWYRRYKNVI